MAVLQPDDFEIGMLVTGHHSVPSSHERMPWGATEPVQVKNSPCHRFENKIYEIIGIQLPYILIKMIWHDIAIENGSRHMVDTRRFVFMQVEPAFLKAACGEN